MNERTEKTGQTTESQAGSKSIVLTGPCAGILGIKAGMTQVFDKNGDIVPVTVIDLQPAIVTQLKTKKTDRYDAVQVGISPKKVQRANKAEKGHFKKAGAPGFYYVQEFRVTPEADWQLGFVLSPDFVKEGELVDVSAVSKGKGYQGGMKRYHMAGGFKTHGASLSHRSLGSIGNRADPAKCFKNKKMAGHMGWENVTIQNLRVVSIDRDHHLMLLRGAVPGPKNSVVTVRKAIKAA